MLSVTTMINTAKPLSLSTPFIQHHQPLSSSNSQNPFLPPLPSHSKSNSITALILPPSSSSPQKKKVYQPFRPPPSPLPPKYKNLDTNERLEILANRLGLWFEYAPLIPTLIQEGFTPPTIEELTGISGVEQNRLVVAAQVRESLVESQTDPDIVSFFETSGAELLYEIRLLSYSQRAAAVRYVVENNFDAKKTQDLARSMKDKPRRRGDKGWESFDDDLPGDCLGFMYFRLAEEHRSASSLELWKSSLEKALEVVESENAKNRVLKELEGKKEGGKEDKESVADDGVRVPVVRMRIGEVAESSSVLVFPVCRAEEREIEVEEAPWECGGGGDFGIVVAEKGWNRWVVLPGWEPVADLRRGGVAVAFKNATVLPWSAKRLKNTEENILVVADRGRKEIVADDGFYLVLGGGNGSGEEGLKVERGSALKDMGLKESLGTVVLVVRPPREENDQLSDEDWE